MENEKLDKLIHYFIVNKQELQLEYINYQYDLLNSQIERLKTKQIESIKELQESHIRDLENFYNQVLKLFQKVYQIETNRLSKTAAKKARKALQISFEKKDNQLQNLYEANLRLFKEYIIKFKQEERELLNIYLQAGDTWLKQYLNEQNTQQLKKPTRRYRGQNSSDSNRKSHQVKPQRSFCNICNQEIVWIADAEYMVTQSCGCSPGIRSESETYNLHANDNILPFLARENGRFGSLPSFDDYSEESEP